MKPHKHSELIKAWADGAEIEWVGATTYDGTKLWSVVANPTWNESHEYRIKPEPKPDFMEAIWSGKNECWVEILWDGETGKLKSAEVLK